MKCPRCQADNTVDARFCEDCGARLTLACPQCGAEVLGMRPLVAHCHLGLGKLSRRTGKRELAQEHLTTATTMYREMDMRFWREQAEKEGA